MTTLIVAPIDEILTAKEVSKILKCSVAAVYRLREQGRLPSRFKLFEGRKGFRWTRMDVEAYLAERMLPRFESDANHDVFLPVRSPFVKVN